MQLRKLVVECLKAHRDQKLKAREIAEWIYRTYPEWCNQKLERSAALTSQADLIQQIVAEIGANRPAIIKAHHQIRTTEGRPRRYYWSEQSEEAEIEAAAPENGNHSSQADAVEALALSEHSLYPMLAAYLRSELGLHSHRIDERRSSNRRGPQGNRWLYPDVVSLEDLTEDWTQEIKNCVSEAGGKKSRLWSFEVKILLNRSNVREAYFQAVSNSSWANFGYLVAADIEGTETLKELRMLAALHGIGFIRLDAENPAESQILIPSRERADIDWANCNRLAAENPDFKDVINLVWQFHRTGDARAADWKA
jgi:hypothetical protein